MLQQPMPYDQQYRQHMHWILSFTPIMTIGNWTKSTHAPTPRAFGILLANHWDHETIRPLTSNTRHTQKEPLLWSCQRLVIKLKKRSVCNCELRVVIECTFLRLCGLGSKRCNTTTSAKLGAMHVEHNPTLVPSLFRAYSEPIPGLFRAYSELHL